MAITTGHEFTGGELVTADKLNSAVNSANINAAGVTATGSTTSRTLADRSADVFNILDYGAVGDGTTDDNASIQAALNAAATTSTYATVVVPKSPTNQPYIFTALVVKSKTTFLGLGGVLKFKDSTASSGSTNYYPISNVGGYTESVFDSLIIDGNKANNTTFNVCDAITCLGKNSSVRNCKITNPPDSGIMFSNAELGECVNNEISGAPDAGIYSNGDEPLYGGEGDTQGMIISSNRIENCVYPGIAVKRSGRDYIVTNNTIINCGNGITLSDFGMTEGGHPSNILIANNYMKDIGYGHRSAGSVAEVGIQAQVTDNVVISGNMLINVSGVGIDIDGSRKCVVADNLVVGHKASPISATGNMGIYVSERALSTRTFSAFADYSSTFPAVSGSFSAFADYGSTVTGTVKATFTAHGQSTNDYVTISGTTNYNGTFKITKIDDNNFYFTDTWVANDATGTLTKSWVKATFTAHGQSTGDIITISGTTSYNDTVIVTKIDDNNFYFNYKWVANDATGTLAQVPIGCTISNNVVRETDYVGINLESIQYSTISSNIVDKADDVGMRIFNGADNNVISANVVEGTPDQVYGSTAINNIYVANKVPDATGVEINGIRRLTSAASNWTPRYAGEFVFVPSVSKLYFATGTTSSDWLALN